MLARCARCQNNFTTDRYGLQKCPHCGSDLMLADPNGAPPGPAAPQGAPASPPPPPDEQRWAPPGMGGGAELPPPPPPPPGGPGGGFGPPPGPPGGPPPPRGELPAPFAERDRLGFFNGYLETWKLVATKPQDFFARVRIDQTGSAILFGVISATVGAVIQGLYSWVASAQSMAAMQQLMDSMPEESRQLLERLLPLMGGGAVGLQVLATPLVTLLFMFLGAGIIHLLLMLFGGAGRGFDATLTVVAYASGLQLLVAVPMCGGLVALVWQAVALIIGLAAAQRVSTGKASAAVLLPVVLLCCCCIGGITMAVGSLVKAFGGGAPQVDL